MKHNQLPRLALLREKFTLDADRGVLIRNYSYGQHKAGSIAGTPIKDGHLLMGVCKKRYLVHRIIYFMANEIDPGEMLVDHVNGVTNDNRPRNLRLATVSQNVQNMHRRRSDNKTGERNVSWDNHWQRWKVSITKPDGKRVQRKFLDMADAITCAHKLRRELFGEFAGAF